jgi:hypothetical protein
MNLIPSEGPVDNGRLRESPPIPYSPAAQLYLLAFAVDSPIWTTLWLALHLLALSTVHSLALITVHSLALIIVHSSALLAVHSFIATHAFFHCNTRILKCSNLIGWNFHPSQIVLLVLPHFQILLDTLPSFIGIFIYLNPSHSSNEESFSFIY